jgi:predicted HicB family RNase H-like nuclease
MSEPVGSPPEGDDTETRITLRLPAQLKGRIEAASAREGLSVNSYIVRALSQQAKAPRGPRVGHRLSGYGRS